MWELSRETHILEFLYMSLSERISFCFSPLICLPPCALDKKKSWEVIQDYGSKKKKSPLRSISYHTLNILQIISFIFFFFFVFLSHLIIRTVLWCLILKKKIFDHPMALLALICWEELIGNLYKEKEDSETNATIPKGNV